MSEVNRKSLAVYLFMNTALIFSLALPAAGMINHLLPGGEPTFERGLLIWLLAIGTCFLLTLPFYPLIHRRVGARMK